MTAEVETNIVAIERVNEYSNRQQEAPWKTVEVDPSWPQKGVVKFENFQVRYREGLDLVLKGINFAVKSEEKVGIVGRTVIRANCCSDRAFDAAFAKYNGKCASKPVSLRERKNRPRGDRKSQEMTIHLRQALSAAIKLELYPKSQIDIFIEVLQADGGNYCASINAATLALIDAGIALKEYVCACTASLANGDLPMMDISHLEEVSGGPTLTVASLPNSSNE